jgi:hypothetical protein
MINTETLRQLLMEQPALMTELFEIQDSATFVAALANAASARGLTLSATELMEGLRQGQREWIERRVP